MNREGIKRNPTLMKWLLIGAAWTLVILFFVTQIVTRSLVTDYPVSFWRALSWQLFSGYVQLAFFPLILWLGNRFRFERQQWGRSLIIHLLAASFFTFAQQAIDALVLPSLGYPPGRQFGSFLETYKIFLVYNFHLNVALYAVVLGVQYGIGYYQMFRERQLRASQLEARLAQSRLHLLKMQLHPHFLFNTLNTISELIYKDPDAAEQMITDLGELLRLSLESVGVQEVPLYRELDFLKKYLEIEQTRFHDRLRIEMEIDPQALDASVPNMILQPIVENAVRHGIAPRAAGGLVSIRAARENGTLRLRVSDDGCGPPGGDADSLKEGVGLSNTRARLQHLYGAAHQFRLRGAGDHGMTVDFTIPYKAAWHQPHSEQLTGEDE